MLPWQHILLRVRRQNLVPEIINEVTVASFCNQSQQNFVIFVCNTKKHLCTKFDQNRKETKKLQKMRNDVIVTSLLKIAQQFLCLSSF